MASKSKDEIKACCSENLPSEQSFQEAFLECSKALKSIVFKYVKRPEDVEDIVQETFVKSFQAQQKSTIRNLKAYFFTTARNLSFKHQALHANKITDYLEDLGLSEVYDTSGALEDEVEAHEQFGIFCEAVRDLPLQCRRVFIMKKIYGLSHDEITKRLGISVSVSNQYLAKGIARCTLYMQERGLFETQENYGQKELDGKAK